MTHTGRRQQWKARIETYKASGLSAKQFCKQHNISIKQQYYWLRKESLKEQIDNTVQWLPVSLNGQEDTSGCNFLTVKVGPAVIKDTKSPPYIRRGLFSLQCFDNCRFKLNVSLSRWELFYAYSRTKNKKMGRTNLPFKSV
jgi:hypothetical protein